jgi:hypothetical protein
MVGCHDAGMTREKGRRQGQQAERLNFAVKEGSAGDLYGPTPGRQP